MYTKVLANDLCPDCLVKAKKNQQRDYARNLLRQMFEPTWRERLDDLWTGHVMYHWLVWFGDFTDTYSLEQRLAQRLPWNRDRFALTDKRRSELKVLNEIRHRELMGLNED